MDCVSQDSIFDVTSTNLPSHEDQSAEIDHNGNIIVIDIADSIIWWGVLKSLDFAPSDLQYVQLQSIAAS